MKRTYYLFNPGRLSRKDNTLCFQPVDADGNEMPPKYLPVEGTDDLYIFGSLDANSALYNFLGKNDIPVHFFDYHENYSGSFMPRDYQLSGKLLLLQVNAHQSKEKRMTIARKFIEGAAFNMIRNLKYYQNRGKDTEPFITLMESYVSRIPDMNATDELMGIEGNIRLNYYEAFNLILQGFEMGERTKQPPQNEVNALISFGNMMCYSQCLRAIHQTPLSPVISFLHAPGERRYSLSLDLAEIFKPILVDRVIFKVINKREIRKEHFDSNLNRCLLNQKGKKIFITAFEERLNETIQHRSLKRNVSYKHLIKLECFKLIKHILEIEEYKPFKIWW
ncbi:MAG: type I-B CRISPR-associated endonuclease Cas1 [Alphaproteobacteria bacterium]|nr:type I-B CRISPR-associated endonuclease Cas1 [Alphaproteobacteria bacterium]